MDHLEARQRFGRRLQARRVERALTQEQLGEALQKSTEHISYLERGNVPPPLRCCYPSLMYSIRLLQSFSMNRRRLPMRS